MGILREFYRRWLVRRHAPPHWRLRPGTIDRRIFRHVVIDNEYRLPRRLASEEVILDIGAHTGSFALAALRRGAGRVVCCEPDPDNFRLLSHNLAPYGERVRLLPVAVWHCDALTTRFGLVNPLDPRNTGAVRITPDPLGTVQVRRFDDLIDEFGPVHLVKLDCEGAEWSVLLTSRRLREVPRLCGEFHLGPLPELFHTGGPRCYSAPWLEHLFWERGFACQIESNTRHGVGLFFAEQCRMAVSLTG